MKFSRYEALPPNEKILQIFNVQPSDFNFFHKVEYFSLRNTPFTPLTYL